MMHHQPTKYHHSNPLTHFLNLHTSHATAAAAAALALATDGLGHTHGHHSNQHHHPVSSGPGVTNQQQHHQSPTLSSAAQHPQMGGQIRTIDGRRNVPDAVEERRGRSSHGSRTDEDEEHDESSNERSSLGGRELKREAFDSMIELCQGDLSESEHNIDVDVDDPDLRREDDGRASHGAEMARDGTTDTKMRLANRLDGTNDEDDEDEGEEIIIDGKDAARKETEDDDPSNRRTCTSSPCADTNTAVLDTDGFVGKSFTIAAILGLRKKQDEAAAAAAAASEYNEGVMNLSTGAGFQQTHQQQQRVAAAAVAAAAMGRFPLVMAAAAAGMEKRDRTDSVDSTEACGGPLAYGGQQSGNGPLTALQNLHQLPGLHNGGSGFSAFHPSGAGGAASGHPGGHGHHHQHGHHPHLHHHHHHHPHAQVNPHYGGHPFHHHQGQQQSQHQQQQQQQQHQHLQQHAAHPQQQQIAAGHHIPLGSHHHGQNHNRDKFKDLGKKTSMSSAAASLKSKRVRTIFTPEQLERLEAEFERQQYMVGPERLYLAHTLQLTEAQVKVWFQNRRIKWRKHHLEITQQRLALIRQRQIASGVPMAAGEPQNHLGQQQPQQSGAMSGGRMMNGIESPELTICTDSMDARSVSDGDD